MYLDAFRIGGDEGFELYKAFAVYSGQHLYTDIWNDQPPLFTLILAFAFYFSGPSVVAARVIASSFGAILCISLVNIARISAKSFGNANIDRGQSPVEMANWFTLVQVAVLVSVMVASPGILTWLISVMLEVPAFALGCCSLWVLLAGFRKHLNRALVCSALVFALALQVKLTAGMLIPGIAVAMFLVQEARASGSANRKDSWLTLAFRTAVLLLQWGGLVMLMFIVFGLLFGSNQYYLLWHSHFNATMDEAMSKTSGFEFSPAFLVKQPSTIVFVVLGLLLSFLRGRWRNVAIPVVWFVTALVVHSLHKPWWAYYNLHFYIPLAWLTFESAKAIYCEALMVFVKRQGRVRTLAYCVILLIIFAWFGAATGTQLVKEVGRKSRLGSVRENDIVKQLLIPNGRSHTIYCDDPIYAFHAKLLLPPELAVVCAKRFWSGNLTRDKIFEITRDFAPEKVLLGHTPPTPLWNEFLSKGYTNTYSDSHFMIYQRL
jgi:hypothetical protein